MTVVKSIEYPETLVVVFFKLPSREHELLEELARRDNTSKSEIIRRALRYYLSTKLGETRPFITKRLTIW